mgnify:CR=1 FL=1
MQIRKLIIFNSYNPKHKFAKENKKHKVIKLNLICFDFLNLKEIADIISSIVDNIIELLNLNKFKNNNVINNIIIDLL